MSTPSMSSPSVDWHTAVTALKNYQVALLSASAGWNVFPTQKDNPKAGAITNWPARATTNTEQIIEWFADGINGMHTLPLNCYVGICTGRESNLWVLDIDNKPGSCGPQSLRNLFKQNNETLYVPKTFIVKTPSGGRHWYFTYPQFDIQGTASALGPGIDSRGWHGLIVAPETVTLKGKYEVLSSVAPIKCPWPWLEDLLKRREMSSEHISRIQHLTDIPFPQLSNSIPPSTQEEKLRNYVWRLCMSGASRDEAIELAWTGVSGFYNSRPNQPWTMRDVVYKVDKALSKINSQGGAQ